MTYESRGIIVSMINNAIRYEFNFGLVHLNLLACRICRVGYGTAPYSEVSRDSQG